MKAADQFAAVTFFSLITLFLAKDMSDIIVIKFCRVKFLNNASKHNNPTCTFNFITVVSSASDLRWKPHKRIIKYQQTQVQ